MRSIHAGHIHHRPQGPGVFRQWSVLSGRVRSAWGGAASDQGKLLAGSVTHVFRAPQLVSRNASGIDLRAAPRNHAAVLTVLIAFLAAFLTGVFIWLAMKSRQAGTSERLRSREEEGVRLTAEVAALRAETGRLSTLN